MLRFLLAAVAVCIVTSTSRAADRPNILWIIGEDLGPELGCYGTPQSLTPNLDRLSAEGVRFTRAFTVTGVCSTSRSSFNTGMYCFTIGAHQHRTQDKRPLPAGVMTLSDWFRAAGYTTGNLRKIAAVGDDGSFYQGTGKDDWNFAVEGKPWDTDKWDELKARQPFFAQINFSETHRGPAWDNSRKHIATPADPSKVVIPPYYPDHPIVREDWAQYLNAGMALDKKIGYVLKRLEEDGLADNTIVIFFGDHGQAMMRGKQWPYDSGLHVPLIIRYGKNVKPPEGFRPGTTDDRLVMSIDWAATSLWMAGIDIPQKMQGRPIYGKDAVDRRYVFGGRDRCDETVDRIRTVRDDRYRYLRNYYPERPFLQLNRYKERTYPTIAVMRILHEQGKLNAIQEFLMAPTRPKEELYDIEKDPYETANLAESPEHAEVMNRMRSELDRWLETIDDQGRFPEPDGLVKRMNEQAARSAGDKVEANRNAVRRRMEAIEKE